jgi:uncharacterized caspase-like protein
MPRKLTDENETELKRYIRSSGKTLDQISAYGNYKFKKDTISRALRNPARTQLENYLLMAEAVGMPKDEAESEWKDSKRKHVLSVHGLD